MYAYAYDRWFGHDRVVQVNRAPGSAGDLIQLDDEYFLLLGDEPIRSELYQKYLVQLGNGQLAEKQLLRPASLQLLHWFVDHWFATYKKSVPLWTGHDPAALCKRKSTATSKKQQPWIHLTRGSGSLQVTEQDGQQLLIFPDIWTMRTCLAAVDDHPSICVLTSRMTAKQKAEAFRAIKLGAISCLCTTYAQLFQDRNNLQQVTVIDAHTWYYKHQQDPRYDAVHCAQKTAALHEASFEMTGYLLQKQETSPV